MKTRFKNPTLATALVALSLLVASRASALLPAPFTTLYQFSPTFFNNVGTLTNGDGANTVAGLLLAGNVLFGESLSGGTNGTGTMFAINTNGVGFTNFHTFPIGWSTAATFAMVGNNLFGTAQTGGTNGTGMVFTLGTNGAGFKDLHSFSFSSVSVAFGGAQTNADGMDPVYGPLLFSSNVLYGTANLGGTNGNGTLYVVNTNGTGFKLLHTFRVSVTNTLLNRVTNSDGSNPGPGMILSGATLYGVTFNGGTNGRGVIFAMGTNGAGFKTLHHFSAARTNAFGVNTNGEGMAPLGRLVLSGNTLYGTTTAGGFNGSGTVFAINTNGSGFTPLHHFATVALNNLGVNTNSDGSFPASGLTLSGGTLYGTARLGGVNGQGAVYALDTTGTIFTNLHSFSAVMADAAHNFINTNSDGRNPFAPLVLAGGVLYGTTPQGGLNANGTVYRLLAPLLTVANPPQLTIRRSGTNIIITWPTNLTGLTLQSATNFGPTAVWITATPPPGIVNTNKSFTNSVSVPRKFYRLN